MLYSAKVLVAQNKSVPWSSFSYLHSCSLELSCLEPSIFECVSSNSPVIQVLWTFQNWIVTYTYKHLAAFHSQPCKWMLLFNKNICQNFLKENVKLKWFLYFKPRFYHPFKTPTSGSLYNNLGSIWCLHCWHAFRRHGNHRAVPIPRLHCTPGPLQGYNL